MGWGEPKGHGTSAPGGEPARIDDAIGGLRPAAFPSIRLGRSPGAEGDPADWSRHSAVSAEEVARLRRDLLVAQAALVEARNALAVRTGELRAARNTLAVRTGELRAANHKLALIHQAMSSVMD